MEVFDHAHSVKGPISLVELLQSLTGEIAALIAVSDCPRKQQVAGLLQKGAFLVSRSAAGAVGYSDSVASYIMPMSQESATDSAVHPTRSHQVFFHRFHNRILKGVGAV